MQQTNCPPEQLFTDIDLAKLYGVKLATLRKWRMLGKGPRWVKLGKLVRYKASDVHAFVESCSVGTSA